jgi:hypothetical protein
MQRGCGAAEAIELRLYNSRMKRQRLAAFSLAAFLALLIALVMRDTYLGDPSIYFAYARNIHAGDWFQFNPGEFSSGATSPLWAVILSLAFNFVSFGIAAKAISLCILLVSLYAASLYVGRSFPSMLAGLILILYFYALPSNVLYESPLLLLAVSTFIVSALKYVDFEDKGLAFKSNRRWVHLSAMWASSAALPLIRPESSVLLLAFWSSVLLGMRSKGALRERGAQHLRDEFASSRCILRVFVLAKRSLSGLFLLPSVCPS